MNGHSALVIVLCVVLPERTDSPTAILVIVLCVVLPERTDSPTAILVIVLCGPTGAD